MASDRKIVSWPMHCLDRIGALCGYGIHVILVSSFENPIPCQVMRKCFSVIDSHLNHHGNCPYCFILFFHVQCFFHIFIGLTSSAIGNKRSTNITQFEQCLLFFFLYLFLLLFLLLLLSLFGEVVAVLPILCLAILLKLL